MSNKEKIKWLDSRGGRTMLDLGVDDRGEYVFMWDGWGGQVKVYLPLIYGNAIIGVISNNSKILNESKTK